MTTKIALKRKQEASLEARENSEFDKEQVNSTDSESNIDNSNSNSSETRNDIFKQFSKKTKTSDSCIDSKQNSKPISKTNSSIFDIFKNTKNTPSDSMFQGISKRK